MFEKNPGAVALYAVTGRGDEGPSHPPSCLRLCPGTLRLRQRRSSFLLLGIVDGHVVIENDQQEERHAQHIGEDGELHVCDHPDQLGSAPTRTTHQLEVRAPDRKFVAPAPSRPRHFRPCGLAGSGSLVPPSRLLPAARSQGAGSRAGLRRERAWGPRGAAAHSWRGW